MNRCSSFIVCKLTFIAISIFYFATIEIFASSNLNWLKIDTINSNLPNNSITDIAIDNNGSLWVATYDGFAKYIGLNQWQIFHTPNVMSSDVCLCIKSQDSIIWVGTVHGLVRYCNGQVTLYDPSNSNLFSYYIYSLEIDANNLLWIGTGTYGVFVFDGIDFFNYSYLNSGNMPLGNIWSIEIDQYGGKWFSCNDARPSSPNLGAIVNYDNLMQWTMYDTSNSFLGRYPKGIKLDNNDNLWITESDKKLYKFSIINNSWYVFDSSNISFHPLFKPCKVSIDLDDSKWVCTNSGIAVYNNLNWTTYDSSNVPFSNEIQYSKTIFIDSFGNKFIGTVDKGLLIFNQNGITLQLNQSENKSKENIVGFWTDNIFTLKFNLNYNKRKFIRIINNNSQVIDQFYLESNDQIKNIDFSKYYHGLFYIIVLSDNKEIVLKTYY